jgi:hypothetical protein
MNPPSPGPRPVKSTALRDAVIAGVFIVGILALLAFGVVQLAEKPKGNVLTGKVVGREFKPLKEQLVEFSGNSLKRTRESDGEYALKVRVDSEGGRVFDVPVSKATYESKKPGDSLEFMRPLSEQK